MPGIMTSIQFRDFLGLGIFLVLWIVLCAFAHVLVMVLRHDQLIGWAVGPFGVTMMYLHEPSLISIWLNVCIPAFVSGSVLYIGLFTALSPVLLPHSALFEIATICCGLLVSSAADLVHALQDLRYPLWGEARVLRTLQSLRANWSRIHFTAFGYSYLRDHFGSNPTELFQVLS